MRLPAVFYSFLFASAPCFFAVPQCLAQTGAPLETAKPTQTPGSALNGENNVQLGVAVWDGPAMAPYELKPLPPPPIRVKRIIFEDKTGKTKVLTITLPPRSAEKSEVSAFRENCENECGKVCAGDEAALKPCLKTCGE